MSYIKQKIYNFIRNGLIKEFTNHLGKVVEEEDKFVCYVNKRKCKKNGYEYIIKCKGIENINQELAKFYKLDKPICYIIDGLKLTKHRIFIFGYDNCEVIIRNCQFDVGLDIHGKNKCTIENTQIQSLSSYLSIGATKLVLNNMNIPSKLSISYPLSIILGAEESIEINDSNIGKEHKNNNVIITSNQELTLNNSIIYGNNVKFVTKKINTDRNSALIASEKVDITVEDFEQINIDSPFIIYNNEKISNNKKSVVLKKVTDPVKIKQLELINLLKKVKFECEKTNAEEAYKYQEKLAQKPISKILKK